MVDELVSIFKTMKLFIGFGGGKPHFALTGLKVPKYQEKANIAWINKFMGWQVEERPINEVEIEES
jgi:hypothetical protein